MANCNPIALPAVPAVQWSDGTVRRTRVRHAAGRPPLPLACRWCGHPPYEHQADSLPSRPGHLYEPPTQAQMRRRSEVRRRLGMTSRFPSPAPAQRVRPPASTMLPIEAAAMRAALLTRPPAGPPSTSRFIRVREVA